MSELEELVIHCKLAPCAQINNQYANHSKKYQSIADVWSKSDQLCEM